MAMGDLLHINFCFKINFNVNEGRAGPRQYVCLFVENQGLQDVEYHIEELASAGDNEEMQLQFQEDQQEPGTLAGDIVLGQQEEDGTQYVVMSDESGQFVTQDGMLSNS